MFAKKYRMFKMQEKGKPLQYKYKHLCLLNQKCKAEYLLDEILYLIYHFRFKDEGQILTLSHVTKDDENIVYKCELAVPPPAPSVFLELKVHPSDWKGTTTIKTPVHQPQSQNLPTTETPKDTASGMEKSSFLALVVLALLSYTFYLGIPL